MIYLQRDNRRKKRKFWLSIGSIVTFFLIIIGLNFFAPHAISEVVHTVSLPFIGAERIASSVMTTIQILVTPEKKFVDENNALKEKLAQTNALQAEVDFLKQEKQQLEGILGRIPVPDDVILTRIISKPSFSPYDTLIVDRGEQEGVREGDLVLLDDTVIVGEISVVYNHTSVVTLYSSPEQKTEVLIGPNAIESIATGKGGGNFELKLPRNTNIKEGDAVTLAKVPTKLFGLISVIDTSPSDAFEHVLFRSSVDISELKFLTIQKHR